MPVIVQPSWSTRLCNSVVARVSRRGAQSPQRVGCRGSVQRVGPRKGCTRALCPSGSLECLGAEFTDEVGQAATSALPLRRQDWRTTKHPLVAVPRRYRVLSGGGGGVDDHHLLRVMTSRELGGERVPRFTACAPNAGTAASPRPSAIPPVATTGIVPAMSMTWRTRAGPACKQAEAYGSASQRRNNTSDGWSARPCRLRPPRWCMSRARS